MKNFPKLRKQSRAAQHTVQADAMPNLCRSAACLGVHILLCVILASAHPIDLGCGSPMNSGRIHGRAVQQSTSRTIQFAKAGSAISCGGTIIAGDSLTLTLSNTQQEYLIEAVASVGTGAWGLSSGLCSNQRRQQTTAGAYTVPASGTVTLRVSWAPTESTVYYTPDCTYTVIASAPPPPPPAPVCPNCASGQYLSNCVCVACPAGTTSPAGSTSLSSCVCDVGYSGSGSTCTSCPSGQYKGAVGPGSCALCPSGSTSPLSSTAVTACSCLPGFTGPNGGTCSACPRGSYKQASGNAACFSCPTGYSTQSTGSTSMDKCICDPQQRVCSDCTAGQLCLSSLQLTFSTDVCVPGSSKTCFVPDFTTVPLVLPCSPLSNRYFRQRHRMPDVPRQLRVCRGKLRRDGMLLRCGKCQPHTQCEGKRELRGVTDTAKRGHVLAVELRALCV